MTDNQNQSESSLELDHILVEQLHCFRRQKSIVKMHSKFLKNDPWLEEGGKRLDIKIYFYENLIVNKNLIHKTRKKRSDKSFDILAKHPIFEWYKAAVFYTSFSYTMFLDSFSQYLAYIKNNRR